MLCKKKQEILVKTGQWYHGSMAKPVTLDIDLGSDASSIKTDSSSVSDKRYSEGVPGSGMARTLPPESGPYGGPQMSPMGGPAVPGYDPSRSLPGNNAAVTMGNEFGARSAPNGALGQTMVDSSGRRLVDQNGRMTAESGARQAVDPTGRPLFDASGKPLMDQSGRAMVDSSGRPVADSAGRPIADQSGRPLMEQTGRPAIDSTGRPVVDQSGRPQLEQTGRPLLDSSGRPLLDFAGNPIMDYSGRQLPDSISRTTTDHASRPVAAGYPDPSSRPPAVDQSGRPVLDQTGRPVMDHHDGSSRPMTDASGRLLQDAGSRPTDQAGRPLPDHAVRGANDFGYGVTTERGSQPKLDPAGRPMFDASGRIIMEPIPVEQGRQPPVDASGKTIVDPYLGPIGDIHNRGATAMDSSSVSANTQRFDVHDRPLGDVSGARPAPDSMRRPVTEQRGLDASLSGGASTEPRGRMLPDIESRAAGGPSVQDWRGDGPRPVGAEGSHPPPWPKDRLPGPVQEPAGVGQRGVVEGQSAPPWPGKESDPAIITAQQRPPPRHVPGEPWRQPPGPHRYQICLCRYAVLLTWQHCWTFKRVIQDHLNWYHSKTWVWFPIHIPCNKRPDEFPLSIKVY